MGITGLLPVVFLPLLGIVQYIILHIILYICYAVYRVMSEVTVLRQYLNEFVMVLYDDI